MTFEEVAVIARFEIKVSQWEITQTQTQILEGNDFKIDNDPVYKKPIRSELLNQFQFSRVRGVI